MKRSVLFLFILVSLAYNGWAQQPNVSKIFVVSGGVFGAPNNLVRLHAYQYDINNQKLINPLVIDSAQGNFTKVIYADPTHVFYSAGDMLYKFNHTTNARVGAGINIAGIQDLKIHASGTYFLAALGFGRTRTKSVVKIDTETLQILDSFDITEDASKITFNTDYSLAYVTVPGPFGNKEGKVAIINLSTNQVIRTENLMTITNSFLGDSLNSISNSAFYDEDRNKFFSYVEGANYFVWFNGNASQAQNAVPESSQSEDLNNNSISKILTQIDNEELLVVDSKGDINIVDGYQGAYIDEEILNISDFNVANSFNITGYNSIKDPRNSDTTYTAGIITTTDFGTYGKIYSVNTNLTASTHVAEITDSISTGISPEAIATLFQFTISIPTVKNSTFSVYPNPSSSFTIIKSNELINYVLITDATGKTLQNIQINDFELTLDISSISNGMYFITTVFKDNTREVSKFIKN
jgi:hypothetical protein